MFVSCSDDKTIRIYTQTTENGVNHFELSFILETKFITCWHTLTYLHLESLLKNTTNDSFYRLNVVSENGYLFTWDINKDYSKVKKGALRFSRRVSVGSIEALSIRTLNGVMRGVSCQSDCSFNLMDFEIPKL